MTKEKMVAYAKEFATKLSIKQGWTGKQHANFVALCLIKEGVVEAEVSTDAIMVLSVPGMLNSSQMRQTLEKAEILEKSVDSEVIITNMVADLVKDPTK